MLKYNEPRILEELGALPNFGRIAFAAACAERQMVDYARTATNLKAFKTVISALNSIWNELMGVPMGHETLTRRLADCMSAMAEPESKEALRTDDAISSVVYALRARLSGHAQEAAWAARTTYASLEYYLEGLIPPTEFTRGADQRILAHPLMQAELQRQERDLSDLTELIRNKGDAVSTIVRLRERAREAAQHFTGPAS